MKDGCWKTLEPQPGESGRTVLAKMLLTKMIYSIPLSKATINIPGFLAGILPGIGLDDLASSICYAANFGEVEIGSTEDGKLGSKINTTAISIFQRVSMMSMSQMRMPVSTYLDYFVLRNSGQLNDHVAKISGRFDIDNNKKTSKKNVDEFIRICGELEKQVNSNEYLKAIIAEKINTGQIRAIKLKSNGDVDFGLDEIRKLELDDQFVLYDAAHAGKLMPLSQLMMDAWNVQSAIEGGDRRELSWSMALAQGAQEYFGGSDKISIDVLGDEFDPTLGNIERAIVEDTVGKLKNGDLLGFLKVLVDIPIGTLKEVLTVLTVPYQLRFFLVQNSARLKDLFLAMERGDWATADDIFNGTTGADQQDGIAPQLSILAGSLAKFSLDPTAGVDFLARKINSGASLGEIIGSAIFWTMWEIQVILSEVFLIKNAYRYISGKPIKKGRAPFVLRMAAIKPVRWGGSKLDKVYEKFLGDADTRRKRWEAREAFLAKFFNTEGDMFLKRWARGARSGLSKAGQFTYKNLIERPLRGVNGMPVVRTAVGKAGSLTNRLVIRPYRAVTSFMIMHKVDQKLAAVKRNTFGLYGKIKMRNEAREVIADEMGVEEKEISNKTIKKIKGNDHKHKVELATMSKEAEVEIEARKPLLYGQGKIKVKFIDGDRRCEAYNSRIKEVILGLITEKHGEPKVALSEKGKKGKTEYLVERVRVVEGSDVSIRIIKNSMGREVAEVSMGRNLLIDGTYNADVIIKKVQNYAGTKVLQAQKLVDDSIKPVDSAGHQDVLEKKIKPLVREASMAYEANYD
ncbi:hypothetical protein ACFLZ2_06210, partial [Candidatus Margulisiibacteriota bacterium]